VIRPISAPVLLFTDIANITDKFRQSSHEGQPAEPHSNALPVSKPSLVPSSRTGSLSAKEITASTPSQIAAAIVSARTRAGLSQSGLAIKLKTARQNMQLDADQSRVHRYSTVGVTGVAFPISEPSLLRRLRAPVGLR
jgi:hypothetical protein